MTAKKQAKKDIKGELITRYMNWVLQRGEKPKSVFAFCQELNINEPEFYQHFGSLKGLEKAIWVTFHTNSEELLLKNKDYESFDNRDKMLSYFYTFFELLTLNRSYVLVALEQGDIIKRPEQLKGLRKEVKSFAQDLIESANSSKSWKISQRNPTIFSEAAWWHFLFLLKFWADDDSAGFEKTDIAIEKSVNTVFDLFENTPLESVIDFGKFLYKENLA